MAMTMERVETGSALPFIGDKVVVVEEEDEKWTAYLF